MEVGVNIDSVYLDFQKAFDKASHNIILRRCKQKGIDGNLGIWLGNYLVNRKQIVIANNVATNELTVQSGVPQGSILGPILFLILIDALVMEN